MKPAPFDYVRATSIDHGCALLAEAGGGAQLLAGGQTLMPLLALRMSQPFILIDIGHLPELQGIAPHAGGLRIGAATRQADALANPLLAQALPVFVTALAHVGHHQTRNRGTIGGSIALGEPAAEMPATAVALGASMTLRSVRGARTMAADALYLGPYATAIAPDEMLVAIDYPAWPADAVPLFREVARRPGDFALVGLVGALAIAEGRIERAGIAWFGMGPTPMRARQAEQALVGQAIDRIDVQAIADLAIADSAPFDDGHASAAYRRSVGRRIFASSLAQALDRRLAA